MTDSLINNALLFSFQVIFWEYVRNLRAKKQFEIAYWGERRGRTRVEQEMRKLTEIQLNTEEGFFVQPIAHIESCYRQCVGTPRQGLLVPSSRARLVLANNMSPEALDQLENFSHVWLTFKFHLNTNTLKNAKAFNGVVNDTRKFTFTAKITPPMLKRKVGVLSTRSPHRPNPIGVTLAKVLSVCKATRTVFLSSCDLVHSTPVLDIKPYVPMYDSVSPVIVPDWINETIETRNQVIYDKEIIERNIVDLSPWYDLFKKDPETFKNALIETLQAEVRSKFQTSKRMDETEKGRPVEVPFDNCIVQYNWLEDRLLEILSISLIPEIELKRQKKLARSKISINNAVE